ncbi:MAG TPA: GNAT family N-acetyltransferase [Kofleriaceae bacterium]|nr:GNAT family N-acetyltransferase [Kofleriaceae bacterium]
MAIEIRAITADEVTAYRDVLMTTFGDEAESDPDGADRMRALIDPAQAWGAFDGTTMVATAATFNHALVVPGGGQLAMAGLTAVSVRPTHRRRGLLRGLMQRHLDDARERGMPISGLWASESSIYGRFDYGIATESDAIEIANAQSIAFRAPRDVDPVEWIDEARAREVLPELFARATADRPGTFVRTAAWWQWRRFMEVPFARAGASKRRHVVARRGDTLVGYVVYRQRGGFTGGLPSGRVEINELIGVDARAERSLWQFVLAADLFPTVTWWNAPTDDLLALSITDGRRVVRRRSDALWLRIGDVARTLAARRYARDGRLRFSIATDRFELAVDDGRATVAPTTHAPELELELATLGSLILGTFTATQLARADRLRGDPRSIALADAMFASSRAPWCQEIF